MLNKNKTKIPLSIKIIIPVQFVIIALLFDIVYQNKDEIQNLNGKIRYHKHDNDFAASDHNHDFDYSNYNHYHSGYADDYHDHDDDYSKDSHDHYWDYSPKSHDHDLDYSKRNHWHY